eukprot:5474836-Amphidinium_carterae.1
MADLKEQQRELLMATMFQRNMSLEMLIPQQLTEVMRALLCHPKSSIENPSWGQQSSGQRSFLDQDTFWVHDEAQSFWIQRRFGGRFMRKRKGKYKGKGFSGRPFFNPSQSKGGKKGASKSSSAIPGK